jgi:leucyl aminopeptidase
MKISVDHAISHSLSPSLSLVVGVFSDGTLTCSPDQKIYTHALSLAKTHPLQEGEMLWDSSGFYLLGIGLPSTPLGWKSLGGKMWSQFMKKEPVNFIVDALSKEDVRSLVYGFYLKSWRFETYHTKARPLPEVKGQKSVFVTPHQAKIESLIEQDRAVVSSLHWARQIVNEPGNVIYPETFVERLKEWESLGITLTLLDEEMLREKGFGALMGVSQGSVNSPYVAILEWKGGKTDQPPIALVGKGVTFDSGGLSLKPASGMEDMKMDKTGAVVVSAVIRSLALRKAKVNALAIVALVENMPSGSAQRPGDIVTSLSGQTIEVLNTDAEGRLILADVLWYVQDVYAPKKVVDVATLTGAVRVALGTVYAGLFSNDDELSQELVQAGKQVGENLWRLPLHETYNQAMNSDNADMKNITSGGVGAGSSTAAQFLHRFIKEKTVWAHLDIAAVDHLDKETPLCPKGGSAFGVQLLDQWIRGYENT